MVERISFRKCNCGRLLDYEVFLKVENLRKKVKDNKKLQDFFDNPENFNRDTKLDDCCITRYMSPCIVSLNNHPIIDKMSTISSPLVVDSMFGISKSQNDSFEVSIKGRSFNPRWILIIDNDISRSYKISKLSNKE